LAEQINNLDVDQQNSDVSIVLLDSTEIIPVLDFVTYWKEKDDYTEEDLALGLDIVDGGLDADHPFLTVSF
jgi:hypothetical protein